MDLHFLAQVDAATLKLELAKTALEAAKAQLETAKQAHEELLGHADSHGLPRAKLKKLAEDRVQALLESGLVGENVRADGGKASAEAKRARKPKNAESAKAAGDDAEVLPLEESLDQEPPALTQ